MIFATFALFGLIATSSAIGPIAKFRPNTPPARPQTQPKLPNPNSNKLPSPAKPAPGQEQVQANNVGGLDKRLKEAQDIINLSDIGEDIEEAILGTAQSTTVKSPSTLTIDATDFAPCKSYASILASCASATTSFYALEYDEQASCACYQASTKTAACQAVPTLDTSYDDYESECHAFFAISGYDGIAEAMDDAIQLPGPGLCGWATTAYSMPTTLPERTVRCAAATPTPTASVTKLETDQGNGAARLLTSFDRGVLMVFGVAAVVVSWMVVV